MKTRIFIISLLAIMALLIAPTARAVNVPDSIPVVPSGEVLNGTEVKLYGPFFIKDYMRPAVEGVFALDMDFTAPGAGVADVKVELLVYSEVTTPPGPVSFYRMTDAGPVNESLITPSTVTDFSREGSFFIPVALPSTIGFYVRLTGVASNPADTVPRVNLTYK